MWHVLLAGGGGAEGVEWGTLLIPYKNDGEVFEKHPERYQNLVS